MGMEALLSLTQGKRPRVISNDCDNSLNSKRQQMFATRFLVRETSDAKDHNDGRLVNPRLSEDCPKAGKFEPQTEGAAPLCLRVCWTGKGNRTSARHLRA